MGVDAGDYDGSGRPSLWVTNFQNELHALYQQPRRGACSTTSPQAAGIAALGQKYVGFGTGFLDVDNDGWEDLFIVNGHVLRHPAGRSTLKQRPVLLRNMEHSGRRVFEDISPQGGPYLPGPGVGRGLAVGDLDNDGWPDLVVSHTNSPVVLLRNEAAAREAGTLAGRPAGRARAPRRGRVDGDAGDGHADADAFAKGGGSYLSAGDRRILFGLGTAEQVGRVTVQWSWGEEQHWEGLEPNHYWELREGEAQPRRQAVPTR